MTVSSDGMRLSLSEFARLLVQIRDHTDSRLAFLTISSSQTREAKDALWKLIIEKHFNDPNYGPFQDVSELVQDVDSTKPPEEFRPASVLRENLTDAWKTFSEWSAKWKEIGVDPFMVNVSRHTLTKRGLSKYEADRTLIMFICLLCINAIESDELVDIFSRALGGTSPNGYENSLGSSDRKEGAGGEGARDNPDGVELRRKKRRTGPETKSNEIQVLGTAVGDTIQTRKRLVLSCTRHADGSSPATPATPQQSDHGIASMAVDLKKLKQEEELLGILERAEEMMVRTRKGSSLFDIARTRYERLLAKYVGLVQEERGWRVRETLPGSP